MKGTDIKSDIKSFLEIHGCAIASQIINDFEVDDGRYISDCIKQLCEDQIIIKKIYRGFDFYILPGNESEVKRKIRITKKYIIEIVKEHGPIMGRSLAQKIKDNYNSVISARLVFQIAKELIEDKILDSRKKALSHIYFLKNNRKQEEEATKISNSVWIGRRKKIITQKFKKFKTTLTENNELTIIDKNNLDKIELDIRQFTWDLDFKGRNYRDAIIVYVFLAIKKNLYNVYTQEFTFDELESWIHLNEILISKIYNVGSEIRRYFIRMILNHPQFCIKESRAKILHTPDDQIRFSYYLRKIGPLLALKQENIENVLELYKKIKEKLVGKNVKGILGALIYHISKRKHLKLSQKEISSILNITEVTLRSRLKDIKLILEDVSTYPKYIEKPDNEPNIVSLDDDDTSETHEYNISETQEDMESNQLYDLFSDDDLMILRKIPTAFLCFLIDKFHNMNNNNNRFHFGCSSKKYYDEFFLNYNLPLNNKAKRSGRYFNFLKGNYISADTIYSIRQSRGYGCVRNLDKRELCKFDLCEQLKKRNRCNRKKKNIWASDYTNMPGITKGWRFVENYHQRVCEVILKYNKLPIIPFLKILYKNEYDNQKVSYLTSRFFEDFNFNYQNATLIFKLDKPFVTAELDMSRETYKDKMIRLFSKDKDGLYQSKCGKKYFQFNPILKHYLNCPECSNELIGQKDENFYYCRCGNRYRYAYQLTNHFEKCQPFIEYLRTISKTLK